MRSFTQFGQILCGWACLVLHTVLDAQIWGGGCNVMQMLSVLSCCAVFNSTWTEVFDGRRSGIPWVQKREWTNQCYWWFRSRRCFRRAYCNWLHEAWWCDCPLSWLVFLLTPRGLMLWLCAYSWWAQLLLSSCNFKFLFYLILILIFLLCLLHVEQSDETVEWKPCPGVLVVSLYVHFMLKLEVKRGS